MAYMISSQTILVTLNNVQIKFNFVEVYASYYKTDNHNVITLASLRCIFYLPPKHN